MGRRKGKLTRRNRALAKGLNNVEASVSHSFIIHRGSIGKSLKILEHDLRKVMEPYTARNLKEHKKNTIKDYVAVSSLLGVKQLVIITRTNLGPYVKFCCLPQGPTLTFKIVSYCLTNDILSLQRRQMTYGKQFMYPACLMTNLQLNSGERHLQLTAKVFMDMFPAIIPQKASLQNIRRCCLFYYDEGTQMIDFRHYSIRVAPVGITKGVKKLLTNKIPNLGRLGDISDFMTRSAVLSDSEAEDEPSGHVTVGQRITKKRIGPQKLAVRLSEIGPRLLLQFVKIEADLLDGPVLYHHFVTKTEEEKEMTEKKKLEKKELKEKRAKEQADNIALKDQKKSAHKRRCIKGMGISSDAKNKESEDET